MKLDRLIRTGTKCSKRYFSPYPKYSSPCMDR